MAKTVSTLISIGLLVAAHRAAVYWQRTHCISDTTPLDSTTMRADASGMIPEFEFFPTNFDPKDGSILLP